MTTIFLAGAENPSHQEVLVSSGISRVAVNVSSLLRRNLDAWSLSFPGDSWEWIAYADSEIGLEDLDRVLQKAKREPLMVVGPSSLEGHKDYVPLWTGEGEVPSNSSLFVTDAVFKNKDLNRRVLSSRRAETSLGVITGSIKPDIGKYDLVISASWYSVMKNGETQVWDGKKMHRYNKTNKTSVREKHRNHIDALGVDVDAVLLDDVDEAVLLALRSWTAYDTALGGGMPALEGGIVTSGPEYGLELLDSPPRAIAIPLPEEREERTLLPGIGTEILVRTFTDKDGAEVTESVDGVTSSADPIRVCDNCYLAPACPKYKAGARCAYSIPVQIRNKDQIGSVLQAIVEIQTQRVLQARFAEEIQGQELGPEVGREMDRLFRLTDKMKNILDSRDSLKMTVEAKSGGGAGVLSSLFGANVGSNAKALASPPVDSEDVIDAILLDN